jgi:hypothetical protein
MMAKHTIEADELDGYEFFHQIASCIGRENKNLRVAVRGLEAHYEVWSEKQLVLETHDFNIAVSAYNDA